MTMWNWCGGQSTRGTTIVLAAIPALGALSLAAIILFSARELLVKTAVSTAAQHARVMASHTEQSFKAVQVLLEVLAVDLRGRDLHAIPESRGREMLRTRMSGALAQVRNMSIMDGEGRQLFLSTDTIVGKVGVADRDYFRLLRDGARSSASGPYVGRNTGRPTFALAQRIDDSAGAMAGAAHAAIQPEFFAQFCLAVRPVAEIHAALVSASGQVVASCDRDNPFVTLRLADLPQFQPTALPLSALPAVLVEQWLEAYPLRVVVALSGRDIARAWRWEVLLACLSAALVLAVSATIVVTVFGRFRDATLRTAREVDLLERLVAERTVELEDAKHAAEAADRAKSRFLAAASHDLRQPFQAMMLYKDILDGRLTQPDHRKVLAGLSTAMEGGQELLNALLHISTLEAGVVDLRVAPVPLSDVLGALAGEFADQAAQRGLRLSMVPCSAVVVTDPVLFRRMIRNLLVNALKYTTRGRVLLGARRCGGAVRVEVWDTGPGIPADRQEEIWEEFSQLHNPERDRAKGLGLGLAIVARTGQLLRHRVSVRSWPGRGSVFWVEVPVQVAAAAE